MTISANSPIRLSASSREEMPPDDKIVPYISSAYLEQEEINLNCKVNVGVIDVSCTHLSALYLRKAVDYQIKNEKLMVRDIFGGIYLIESILPEDIGKIYKSMIDRSCGRHIVACRKFGDFLCGIAKDTSLYEQIFFY
ncbi:MULTISPECIES: ShET2/EspL2 family type III secretion system effector toxin [Candidatus Ichthyocystis]|uniref:ShET2/EspL2 family type III secretion system effector toxin n=1 Tax=Candidatus Ichthyocystis TaxID=2929841 RepID=UPI000B879789|nr:MULTISPECIES: ShET2/EspL2 family type III secretion system effector toxin [Ichthyocystis]